MKVSEKSLELNIGAELLMTLRRRMPKTYLRGLTQREESQQGVDFFAQLHRSTRLFAFQFKAPRKGPERSPYRYTLKREQHDLLFDLAQRAPSSVFYVFPFYVTEPKLCRDVPRLMQDTWFLRINDMKSDDVFGTQASKIVRCCPGLASINPVFELERFFEDWSRFDIYEYGISPETFADWYQDFRLRRSLAAQRRNPWLARGLRLAICDGRTP